MSHRWPLPMLLLLCVSLFLLPSVSSFLSFNIHFSQWGYDPQEILFHQISPINQSYPESPYTGHTDKVVLRRKKKKNFVPKVCDCSRFDGLMYGRPALLRDEATDEVASFKMTLCLRVNREAGTNSAGLFMFLVPYPWNRRKDHSIEVPIGNQCSETFYQSNSLGNDPVVCAHVHYDSAQELLKTNVRVGDGSCLCVRKIDRRLIPKEAAVGFASTIAGHPIKLHNILTWAFHSTLESNKPPPLQTDLATGAETESSWVDRGDQRVRLDPWNRNAELNLRYQRSWQQNWQLTCSISVSLSYGNANEDPE